MTDIRTAAGFTEIEWDEMTGPDSRWKNAMRRLYTLARTRGADHKDTEALAVALIRWQNADPYRKYPILEETRVSPLNGSSTLQATSPFRYAWQVLVARVREEPI